MKKVKNMLQTYLETPIHNLKTSSGKVYERYQTLFRSIRRLAGPAENDKEERKK